MSARLPYLVVAYAAVLFAGITAAQTVQIPPPKAETPPARDLVAARVNGQPILEFAVFRSLMREPPEKREDARKHVLNYLIDNMIVDQYLLQIQTQLKIQVEPKEVDENVAKIKKEATDGGKDFDKMLKELMITEAEMRAELTSALRWDKFVLKQGPDAVLHDYFKKNIGMFNGSETQAKHILLPVTDGKKDAVIAQLAAIKKKIEDEVAVTLVKLPAGTDAITREKERAKAIDKAFAEAATKDSTCPSKKDGGDLGFFPRVGAMVEPFAQAAFALKPYQISEPVATEFGYHLILAVDSKPGRDVKFEDAKVKAFVQEVYADRLRDAVLTSYKAKSKIEIVERKK